MAYVILAEHPSSNDHQLRRLVQWIKQAVMHRHHQ